MLARLTDSARRIFAADPPPEATFGPSGDPDLQIAQLRLRKPILAGSIIVLVLVFGLLLWAAVSAISGAVVAPGTVRVEGNSKVLRSREGGVVRRILVKEGDRVRTGQTLIQFDQVTARAGVDIWQAQNDAALADIARFQAEMTNAPDVRFPPELLSRQNDPNVASLIAGQRNLFQARMTLYRSQHEVLSAQALQLGSQISGLQAQVAAAEAQSGTIAEELRSLRELNQLGYAPRSRLLQMERGAAGLKGQRGDLIAQIARARQAIGEVRLQLAQLDDKRQTDAATGLRAAQDKLADAAPKLRASSEQYSQTVIRAPADGYVFNLSQFTEGGVAQPGETLMQIVPVGVPLSITAKVTPNHITDVRVGQEAQVTLTAYNTRTTPPVKGVVALVSADAEVDEKSQQSFYVVRIKVDPAELAKAGPEVRLTPGMPAQVSIITGSRTIMDYILAPFTDAMRTALREK